jgi:hypothetical protein
MAVKGAPVSTPAMKAACGDFERASSTAKGQLRRVKSATASLRATGHVSVELDQAMNDWQRQFDVVIRELDHMIEVMGGPTKAPAAKKETAISLASAWAGGLTGR